jgi:hypothetical protein
LYSSDGKSLIRYFGRDPAVRLASDIEILARGSFWSCRTIRRFECEPSSKLRCIADRAFAKCTALRSVSIPPSVEVLAGFCFRKCRTLLEVRVESGSKLREVQPDSFAGCSMLQSIVLPMCLDGADGVDLSGARDLEIVWC